MTTEHLEHELAKYKSVIHDILKNGIDEEIWPPGTEDIDALTNYVKLLEEKAKGK